MAQYVQKIRVPVRLARFGASPVAGVISLAPRAEVHDGPETLLECLNAATRVVPFIPDDEGAVLLVTRDQIEWIEPDPSVELRFVRPDPYMATREEAARVRMMGGETLEGLLSMEMPNEFNRASDYLNSEEVFFPFRMMEGTRLLNKRCVVDVLIRSEARLPRAA